MPNESTEQELQRVKSALVALETKVNEEKAQKTEYLRAWRRENAEKIRAYRAANKEKRDKQNAEWRRKNPERVLELSRKWASENREHRRSYKRDWDKNNPRKRETDYQRNHSPQQAARMKLRVAVRAGKLLRPDTCSKCGITCKPHGHHPDYAKPLEVIWLCPICHSAIHSKSS